MSKEHRTSMPQPPYLLIKRIFDLVGATLLFLLSAPLVPLIVVCIVAESGRPVWFRQARGGWQGRLFMIVKFRTLRLGNHDPAYPEGMVTRVGRFLRRWGLDELPQLWNVLRGDMSLIGPRPALPHQVAAYEPFERRRLEVRPGITGWAQVHGRNALDWPERIQLDVWYVDHLSLKLDLYIMLRTGRTLFSGKGVYTDDPPSIDPVADQTST